MKRPRGEGGKFVKHRHADDVQMIAELNDKVANLRRALKDAIDERDAQANAATAINNEKSAREDFYAKRVSELNHEIGNLGALRDHHRLQEKMRACERVFLAGLVKSVWGLRFWMAVTFHWDDWVTLRKTLNGEWGPKGDGVASGAAEHEDFPGAL